MGRLTQTGMNQGDLYQYLVNLRTQPLGNSTLAIMTGEAAIENTVAISYTIDGTLYTLGADTEVDDGAAQRMIADYWNIMVVSADTSLALDGTWGAGTTGWVSESEAIANMPPVPADQCAIGYVTVKGHATLVWTSGTDDYAGGGGNPAQTTTLYDLLDVNNLNLI